MMEGYSAILFHSPAHSLWAARLLKKQGIESRMIPIPRHLSSDCGYCVRILTSDTPQAEEIIRNNSVEYDRIEQL